MIRIQSSSGENTMKSRWLKVSIFALILALVSACAAPATPAPTAPPATAVPTQPTAAPTAAPTTAPAASSSTLTVFAASSLTAAFGDIGKNFQTANPGTTVTFNFAGSQQLAQQIGQGAPADVFASANGAQMDVVIKSGQVVSGTTRTFVRNRLVVIYPTANPGGVTKLQDLAKPGLKIVLADKSVPVGGYALTFLSKASASPDFTPTYSQTVLASVVSYETDVKQVLAKVSLGEADAGIVYTTDITPDAAGKVGRLDIPDALNTIATYPIGVIKGSPNAALAQKFMDYVLSADGQAVLAKWGYITIS
jgi:molybdate transport system substrate-binding protein